MAGKTGVVIGFLHERFIHVPIEFSPGTPNASIPQRLVALRPRHHRSTGAVHLNETRPEGTLPGITYTLCIQYKPNKASRAGVPRSSGV